MKYAVENDEIDGIEDDECRALTHMINQAESYVIGLEKTMGELSSFEAGMFGCPHKWDVAGLWICMYDDNDFQCEPRVKRGDCPIQGSQSKGVNENDGD